MKDRRKKNSASANLQNKSSFVKASRLAGWKLWRLRLLALIGIPVLFLSLVELILRLSGFGYPTAFLLPFDDKGQKFYVQNDQFGWRFFGPKRARLPNPIFISQAKAPDTVRIFVFGGSAAFGDPKPDFGLPRMLQAMLSLRYPGAHFEVINAAMTAINSNVVLPIARDCAKADGNVWVIYMGNNEVVGPFGAGTVFGTKTPPLPLIHANIALQTTRIGQLLESARRWIQESPPDKNGWGGMAMFLNQQVRADDPRMKAVYAHFQKNLADIIRVGQRSGAGIVVSTVAVNLKDCAPFASSRRQNLPASEQKNLTQLGELGTKAREAGKLQEAVEDFRNAEQIDDSVAEIHFQKAECELALGNIPEAQKDFSAARDLDTLRFRCDSRLNDLIRQAVSNREDRRVLLADADRVFAEQSPDGLPGDNFFYEHVHLNFDGNYLLAKTIAEQVQKLLPQKVVRRADASQSWPSEADCARRLGWSDLDRLQALSEIFGRMGDPPFTAQSNHRAQLQLIMEEMKKLAWANQPAGINNAQRICEKALIEVPDDALLHQQLALLKQQAGDLNGAISQAWRAVDLLPSDAEAWAGLGVMLAQQRHPQEAFAAFRQALQLDPLNVLFMRNLALSEVMLGRRDEAIHEFKRALAISPRYGPAWLGLGTVYEQTGRTTKAQECYRNALTYRVPLAPDLIILAHFYRNRRWFEGAATSYEDAIELSPWNAALCVEAEQNLAAWAHEIGSSHASETTNLMNARLNLGVALANVGRNPEAVTQFEQILQTNPTNAIALHYVQALRAGLTVAPEQPITK